MREIVFDTETTGFDPFSGDRLVEIGCVEVENFLPTGKVYHQYINPERDMPEGAFKIHGLSAEFLKDYPTFAEVYANFIDFVGDANLVAHNADFDMKFINYELAQVGHKEYAKTRAIDTLDMARRKFPGSPNTLDALCKRFSVDNSNRIKHGALLDAELLAEVYLELRGGRQRGLDLDAVRKQNVTGEMAVKIDRVFRQPRAHAATGEEIQRHNDFVSGIGENALWYKIRN